MATDPDDCAFPLQPTPTGRTLPSAGLSKREYYEAAAMQGLIIASLTWNVSFLGPTDAQIKAKARDIANEMMGV